MYVQLKVTAPSAIEENAHSLASPSVSKYFEYILGSIIYFRAAATANNNQRDRVLVIGFTFCFYYGL